VKQTLLAAIGISLLAGCNLPDKPASHYTVYVDPAFSYEDQETVIGALDAWEHAVTYNPPSFDVYVQNVTCNDGCLHVITVHPDSQADMSAQGEADANGYCNRYWSDTPLSGANDYSNIYISRMTPGIAAHEIGHALDLHHTTECGPLMQTYFGKCQADSPTAADVEAYHAARGE
jgi:hypothetical protein